ncbi:MAG: DMT family transporter [Candidatus Zixiibacteriota bacterium]
MTKKTVSLWVILVVAGFHQIIMGGTFPIARIILVQTDPMVVAFFRYCISGSILCLIAWRIGRRPNVIRISPRDKKTIILLGFIIVFLNQTVFLIGQRLTTSAHGGLIFAITPIFVYLMAMKHLGEVWIPKKGFGIALAVAGSAIIIFENGIQFKKDLLAGDIVIIIAVVAWAYYTVFGKPLVEKYGALRITAYTVGAGALMYVPVGLFFLLRTDLSHITPAGWWAQIYISVVTSVIGYSVWFWLVKHMEASRAAVLTNIQPVIAGILGYYILGEGISNQFVIGGIVILAGVYLTQRAK